MKKFLKAYAMCLIFMEVFFFFGGVTLFEMDTPGQIYRAGAVIALILTVAGSIWLRQEERINLLEKELQNLKEQNKSESEDTVS